MVNDILAGDRNIANLFYSVAVGCRRVDTCESICCNGGDYPGGGGGAGGEGGSPPRINLIIPGQGEFG